MPPKYNTHTPVIFRMFDGKCVAMLPTLPPSNLMDPQLHCYAIVGNEITSLPVDFGQRARLATHKELIELRKRLRLSGFRVRQVARIAAAHHQERIERAKARGLIQ